MNTVILLVVLAFGAPYAPVSPNLIIPYQSRGNVELYSQCDFTDLWIDISLSHSYEFRDEIFISPTDFQGASEFYTLGFYIDLDTRISNMYDANNYRILYWFPEYEHEHCVAPIPEPSSSLVFLVAIPLFLVRGTHLRKLVNDDN